VFSCPEAGLFADPASGKRLEPERLAGAETGRFLPVDAAGLAGWEEEFFSSLRLSPMLARRISHISALADIRFFPAGRFLALGDGVR